MKLRHVSLAATLLLLSGQVFAQASGTGDIAVTINNQAITLANIEALNFGTVLPFGRDGSVRVNVSGQPTTNPLCPM